MFKLQLRTRSSVFSSKCSRLAADHKLIVDHQEVIRPVNCRAVISFSFEMDWEVKSPNNSSKVEIIEITLVSNTVYKWRVIAAKQNSVG